VGIKSERKEGGAERPRQSSEGAEVQWMAHKIKERALGKKRKRVGVTLPMGKNEECSVCSQRPGATGSPDAKKKHGAPQESAWGVCSLANQC